MRRLVRNVKVGNDWYGPAYDNATNVPDDVAEQITNPKAWDGDDQSSEPEDKPGRNEPKTVWVDYAVAQGASREEAESMSKADLVEAFG